MIGGKYGGISNKGYRSDYNHSDYSHKREKKQEEERSKKSESKRKPNKEKDSDDNEAEDYKKKVRSRAKNATKDSTKEEPPKKQPKEKLPKPAANKQLVDLLDFDEDKSAVLPSSLGGENENVISSDNDFGNYASAPSNALEDFWSQPVIASQPVRTQKVDPFDCNEELINYRDKSSKASSSRKT